MNASNSMPGFGNPMNGLWDAMEQLRDGFERRFAPPRMARGDVRAAILALLAEQPMHGYQIIQEIADRSDGAWKPSPGSVYPTLQLLADEGLIEADEAEGRKTYSLTDAGREAAEASEGAAPWEGSTASSGSSHHLALPKAGAKLAQAAAQVGRDGSPAQVEAAIAVLEDARRKLYAILAQE
ncbi:MULTISPECIES: PadR family transcriptional regulator [Microbacterium]|uniref:PadR family transcriptional regulator n=1 Tax=Microbacterium TaxID=33882 RepID=UPI001E2D1713|nr:PadR family transcriptional regulator [Microbacterium nymphoidis]MCD2498760.1 PadR family transcriptional regulator [Microbacterium nymphoidis]